MREKIISQLESLLLVASKELSFKKAAEILDVNESEVSIAIEKIKEKFNRQDSGINLLVNNKKILLVTNSANTAIIKKFIKEEEKGELTKPSLETLTIIAYRQPITKTALEQIRGVNCSLILRNLMIRGLVEAKEDSKMMETYYSVTTDFLKFLGINDTKQLPDYEKLNSHENLNELLDKKQEEDVKISV